MSNGPVKPGFIKMVRLAKEGRLGSGDLVETVRLGVCTVVSINSIDEITVKNASGERFRLGGFGWTGARLNTREPA